MVAAVSGSFGLSFGIFFGRTQRPQAAVVCAHDAFTPHALALGAQAVCLEPLGVRHPTRERTGGWKS